MEIKINRDVLLNNLNVVANGLPTKTPIPALYSVKISAVEGGLLLTTSKSDISIQALVVDETLSVIEEGELLVSGKIFIDIIKKISSKELTIKTEGNNVKINGGRSHYTLTSIDANEYPDITFIESDSSFEIGANVFSELVKTCVFSAAQNEKKPILTGVNFSYGDGKLKSVATDSFRLSQNSYDITLDNLNKITVPSKALNDLLKCIGDYEGMLECSFLHNKMLVKFDNVEFQTILLDGNYPDTSKLIANEFPLEIKFNREELIDVVDRVSIMIGNGGEKDKEITYSVVTLSVTPEGTVLSSQNSQLGNAKEEISPLGEVTGAIELAFSSKYFIEALKSFKSEIITLHLTSDVRPFIITEDNSNLIQLILPVRLS